ncbi:transposase [Streptomyces noursei]|uniref:transposase n=1 Tax=Streptomyces noursei TaxID=1971 RepID=UPI0023B85599|nr:transposase [Streptomyces noursei]
MAEIRKRYDAEFRAGAVRVVREAGKPIAQIARDLGIDEGTLSTWVSGEKETTRAGLDPDERAELARLRKENHEPRNAPASAARRASAGADAPQHRSLTNREPQPPSAEGCKFRGRAATEG